MTEKFASTFTLQNFSSTAKLADNDVVKMGSTGTFQEKEYNPFEHRKVEHPNSNIGSLVHLLKSSLGSGILAMPMAFKNGGLLVGAIGTFLVGFICTHCVHILVKCSHELCARAKIPSLGFAETAEAAFKYGPERLKGLSKFAKNFVDIALVLTYYSGNCVYVVFIADSLHQLAIKYFPELEAQGWTPATFMWCLFVPLALICQIRELKYLVPFSMLANILIGTSLAITIYYMFRDMGDVSERELYTSIPQLPMFFTTVIFAMEGIGVVLPVENTMKKPQFFLGCPGVLNIAMATVIILYAAIGFLGYMAYGDLTEPNITINLSVDEMEFVDITLALTYYGSNCVYIVMIGKSIFQQADYYIEDLTWTQEDFMWILIVPFSIMCQLRELKYLVPFAMLANGLLATVFIISLYYMFRDMGNIADRDLFSKLEDLPLFFSTVIFAMDGIGVVFPLENSMKHPENFLGCPGVLNIAMSVVITLYASVGLFGYMAYGNEVEAVITFNLPADEIPAQIVKVSITIAVMLTFCLQFFVPHEVTWRKVFEPRVPKKYVNITQVTVRIVVIVLSVVVAVSVGNLEYFIGFVGALSFSILGLLVPAIVETVTYWEYDLGWMQLLKNIGLMIIGLVALFTGGYTNLAENSRIAPLPNLLKSKLSTDSTKLYQKRIKQKKGARRINFTELFNTSIR